MIEMKRTSIIKPMSGWFDIHLGELLKCGDLIFLFVKRDFIAIYKQTILGPIWFLLQPLMSTLVFTIVFGFVAQLSTDGIPHALFYLSGIICWFYFSECLLKTSETFITNRDLFGKVYFPRLTIPISIVITNLITFGIQFLLLLIFLIYYYFQGYPITINWKLALLPLLVIQMAALGLGCGIIVSSLTTKYKDLQFLLKFGIQLWMYATPIVYPISIIPVKWHWVILLNPMSAIVETFRNVLTGAGRIDMGMLGLSAGMTLFLLIAGLILFSRIEKTVMDTV